MVVRTQTSPDSASPNTSVLLALKTPEAFLNFYSDRGTCGTVFVPGHLDVVSGSRVDLDIAISDGTLTFGTHGIVRWKRTKASRGLAAGIGVEFHPSEIGTRDLILRFARGENVPELQQRARRFPASLELDLQNAGALRRVVMGNVSQTGLFVHTPRVSAIDTVIPVRIVSEGVRLEVDAEVRWNQEAPVSGMGMRFLFENQRTLTQIRSLVEGIRRSMVDSKH